MPMLRKITAQDIKEDTIDGYKLITPLTKKQIKRYAVIRSDYLVAQFESKFSK